MKPLIGAIIQARLGSHRLPSKILKRIDGNTVLEHVIRRVSASSLIDKVVVAVPEGDGEIIAIGTDIFYGSENDVLDRFYQCARKYKFDVIVRITADCPLIPPFEIDRVIACFLNDTSLDYVTNRPYVIDGWDVEVFSMKALSLANQNALNNYDREHVTPYIKREKSINQLFLKEPKLSLDDEEDYARILEYCDLESKYYHEIKLNEK